MIPSTSPTATTSPACFIIFCSTPSCSAKTSRLILSVSSSTRASPWDTASPSRFSQFPTTASTIDSPRAGTRISTAMFPASNFCNRRTQRALDQALLLGLEKIGKAGRRTRGFGARDDPELDLWLKQRLEARIHILPRPHILRLLLHPDRLLRPRIIGQHALDGRRRERVKLFHAHQGHILSVLALLAAQQVDRHLARTEDKTTNHCAPLQGLRVIQHWLEVSLGQFREHGPGERMAQETLGGHHHQGTGRAREVESLAAQDVEVLSGGRTIDHTTVVLRGERQVALQACAGMFRSLALISMWQQQNQRGFLQPLRPARGDKLIDNDLRDVGEVAKLSLPEHQGIGRVNAVPVLKAHHRDFA